MASILPVVIYYNVPRSPDRTHNLNPNFNVLLTGEKGLKLLEHLEISKYNKRDTLLNDQTDVNALLPFVTPLKCVICLPLWK